MYLNYNCYCNQQVTRLVVIEVRSESFGLVAECSIKTDVMLRLVFIVECVIARFLCAMRVFEVQASSLPLGYL